MKNGVKETTTTESEDEILKILISGTGNVNIEKKNENSFKVVADRTLSDSVDGEEIKSEEEARDKANQIIYKQLATKLEKSIRTENLVLLTGAGTSEECGGLLMAGLWKAASEDPSISSDWSKLLELAGYNPEQGKENLEELLSNLQTLTRAHKINTTKGEDFSKVISAIEDRIVKECRKVKIIEKSSHVRFLTRILKGRNTTSPRLKIFTLNYDSAFEQAGDRIGAVVIDGFLFSYNKGFKSSEFDLDIVQRERSRIHYEENFYSRVFHLYKMHGSIDWRSDESDNGMIFKDANPSSPVLIYPNSSKFEKSFEMPFFEMVSRLQGVLRKENTTLFIVGYGFGDAHVNRIIEESVRNNPNLEIFIIKPTIEDENIKGYIEDIEKGSMNVHLLGNTFDQFSSGLPDVKIGDKFLEDESKYGEKSI